MNFIKISALVVGLFLSCASVAEVAVVVNKANTAVVSDSDISRVFLGKLKQFANGTSVEPVNQKMGSAVRNEFESKVLNKSASQVKAYWSKQVFSGKGKPPQEVASDQEVLAIVSANAGAIGYVDAASVNDSVKVVKKF
jgi:ABC-type phosphate transport system substrate-binding protein